MVSVLVRWSDPSSWSVKFKDMEPYKGCPEFDLTTVKSTMTMHAVPSVAVGLVSIIAVCYDAEIKSYYILKFTSLRAGSLSFKATANSIFSFFPICDLWHLPCFYACALENGNDRQHHKIKWAGLIVEADVNICDNVSRARVRAPSIVSILPN